MLYTWQYPSYRHGRCSTSMVQLICLSEIMHMCAHVQRSDPPAPMKLLLEILAKAAQSWRSLPHSPADGPGEVRSQENQKAWHGKSPHPKTLSSVAQRTRDKREPSGAMTKNGHQNGTEAERSLKASGHCRVQHIGAALPTRQPSAPQHRVAKLAQPTARSPATLTSTPQMCGIPRQRSHPRLKPRPNHTVHPPPCLMVNGKRHKARSNKNWSRKSRKMRPCTASH